MPLASSFPPRVTARRVMYSLCAVLAGASAAQAQPTSAAAPSQLVVSGQGLVRVRPDRASLEVVVATSARTAAEAGTANARRLRAVLDTLRGLGYAKDDLATVGFAIQPEWRSDGGRGTRPVGYVARNGVRVRVTDLDRLGSAIDAALAAGANHIGNIQFSVLDEPALQLAALDSAVAQARQRAAVMARAAGGTLGALLQLTTERDDPPPGIRGVLALQTSRVEDGTSITPTELTVRVVVQGRWEFLPKP